MGFEDESTNSFVDDQLKSVNVINLQRPGALYLLSNICTDDESNILECIYGSAFQDFSMIVYEAFDPVANAKKITHTSSNTFRFQLVDSEMQNVDLNGQHMLINLTLFEMAL
jgi:hypothetical protein